MRRLALALLMPLLMLLSQQGAAWHEIGHWQSQSQQHQQQQKKDDPADKLCAACLSFAQLGATAAPPVAPPLLLADAAHVKAATEEVAFLAAPAPQARSRGPPIRL